MDDSSENDIHRRFINQVQEADYYRDELDKSLTNEMIEVEQVDIDVEQLYLEQTNQQRLGGG